MDVMCGVCGEPWDIDELHDNEAGVPFKQAMGLLRTQGCGVVFGTRCAPPEDPADRARVGIAREVMDLLGDDVDGAAAMLEDFNLLGGDSDLLGEW